MLGDHDHVPALDLDEDDRVFVLTGAGISAESGIPTFRDAGGLWESHRVEEVASPEGWHRDPALVWRFYSQRRSGTARCQPNAAHRALAALEKRLGERVFICTQNVDALHEAAGSSRVLHVHGQLFESRCSNQVCALPPFEDHQVYTGEMLPRCPRCQSLLRPDIVWFGEEPKRLLEVDQWLAGCTVFIAIGTSGVVFPVSGFVQFLHARRPETRRIYVGPEPPANAAWFSQLHLGRASEVVPRLLLG